MRLHSKFRLPREHGAWVMLYVPYLLGLIVARRVSLPALLLLAATTALFVSRESILVWMRARNRGREAKDTGIMLLVYLAAAACCGSPLILVWGLYWLIPLALCGVVLLFINGEQAAQLDDRSIGGELLAICGLTMTAPAGYYAARGVWDKTAVWLWLFCVLYFASSVFYIKLRIYGLNPRRQAEQRRMRQSCAFYHSFLLVALLALFALGSLPLFSLIAFTPILARTFWSLSRPVGKVNLKRAGILEIIYSVVFLIFIALSFGAA